MIVSFRNTDEINIFQTNKNRKFTNKQTPKAKDPPIGEMWKPSRNRKFTGTKKEDREHLSGVTPILLPFS